MGDGDEHWSEWLQFRTASEAFEPFSFIYFGDAQNDVRCIQRWMILAAVPLLAITLLSAPSCAASAERPGTAIRVMSYNIAAGHGDLGAITEVIGASEADVIGLQEVDVHWSERSGFEDQAAALAKALDMDIFFASIYRLKPSHADDPPREYGLAVLSIHPIVDTSNHAITRLSTQHAEPRPESMPGFPEVAVEVGGDTIHLFNTHLDYRSDPAVREIQVDEMLEIVGRAERPAILLGDLNAEPGDAELRPLFTAFHDVWAGEPSPGLTFPADAPEKRIDYILVSDHFGVDGAHVVGSDASDHRAVVADLRVRSPD